MAELPLLIVSDFGIAVFEMLDSIDGSEVLFVSFGLGSRVMRIPTLPAIVLFTLLRNQLRQAVESDGFANVRLEAANLAP